MGKGDRKTRRGKVHKGTFGVTRLRKPKRNFINPEGGIKKPTAEPKPKANTAEKKKVSTKKAKSAKAKTE